MTCGSARPVVEARVAWWCTVPVQIFGFVAATSASTDGDDLRLGEAAFSEVAVAELPTTLSIAVLVVYAAEPGEDVSFAVGLRRPDGSHAENVQGLTVVSPGRYVHLDVPVDLFEQGEHVLLLHPLGDTAVTLASYPFTVLAPRG